MKLDLNSIKKSKVKPFCCSGITKEEYNYYAEESGDMFPFVVMDDWICMILSKTKNNETYYFIASIASRLEISKCNIDIVTNERSYTISAMVNGECIVFDVKADVLTTVGLKELLKMGVLYDERQAKELQRYLMMSAYKAKTQAVHTTLGWSGDLFLSSKSFPETKASSRYIGGIDFHPKGSKEIYLDMIKSQVLQYTPLLFVWLIGFCSIILAYLNKHFDFGCLIFALNNLSSKGKTTAAMLSTSITSNPIFDRGLITNFSGTSNAVLNFVSHSNGHTVVLDEAGTAEALQSRKLLYQMCSGRERKRLNTSGELKETAEFNSAIIVTSEHSIIDSSAPNGIRARIFELTDALTISAKHSNIIKTTILNNYGLLYDDFISYVIDYLDDVLADYNNIVQVLKNGFQGVKGELTDRVLEKLAVIYLTAYYAKDCFVLEFNLESIKEYIYTLEKRINTEIDIADKALDCILDYVSRNSSKFIRANISDYESCVEGKIIKSNNFVEISILKSVAEAVLAKNGYESIKTLVEKWRENQILLCEKDRAYKRVKLTKDLPAQPCYVFKLPMCSSEHITKHPSIYESVSSDNLDDVDINF